MTTTDTKYDWIITAGETPVVYYIDILENMTKQEVGAHIKENVKTLYNYFFGMPAFQDFERGKIGNMMNKLFKKYGKDKFNPKTEKEFDEIVNIIELKLKEFSDEDIVNEFGCLRDDDSDFIHINTLTARRVHERFL